MDRVKHKPITTPKRAPLKIPVGITDKDGNIIIVLRREIYNEELIKMVIYSILSGEPLVIYPYFTNHLISLASLSEKDIVHYDMVDKVFYWGDKIK